MEFVRVSEAATGFVEMIIPPSREDVDVVSEPELAAQSHPLESTDRRTR
jgi:hypothetical protein